VALFQAVGEADPASLNTLSLQLSGGGTSAQKQQEILDHARAHAIRGHPAMQTITRVRDNYYLIYTPTKITNRSFYLVVNNTEKKCHNTSILRMQTV